MGDHWCWPVFCDWAHRCCDAVKPSLFIAVFVARTFPYWIMINTNFCDTSWAAIIFHVTNGCGSRRQVGKWWIMRGMPWVLQKWSDSGKRYWGLLWSWETESTPFPRTSLSMRLIQWTPILGLWLKFLRSLKSCVWAEVMNWCASSGRSSLCLLSESTWM